MSRCEQPKSARGRRCSRLMPRSGGAMSSKRVARCDVDHGAADCFERRLSLASLPLAVPKDRFAARESRPHAHVSRGGFMGFRFRTSIHHPARVLACGDDDHGPARRGQRPPIPPPGSAERAEERFSLRRSNVRHWPGLRYCGGFAVAQRRAADQGPADDARCLFG
jgi:hypothetical protein